MVDTHYDLLSIAYVCYLKNDFTKIEKFASEIKNSGVKSIFANLYFESIDEMKEELHPNYYNENVSVLEMFKIGKLIIERYLPDIDFVYSIEGCDYIKTSELKSFYDEGLRSIILVWNTENIYGSGNRTNKGLTKEGIEFLNEAINLGIGIDLSHANEPTFYGMIDVIKDNINNGKKVLCYASHSNSRRLTDKKRNLTDEQLYAIKEVNGYVGVLSNAYFVSCGTTGTKKQQSREYLEHIIHISNIIGKDKVMLSTDDMRFVSDVDPDYGLAPIYNYLTIKEDIEKELLTYFNEEDTNNILFNNAYDNIVSILINNTEKKKLVFN